VKLGGERRWQRYDVGGTRTLWERTDIRQPGNLGHEEEEEEGLMGDRKEAGPKKVAAECCSVKEQ